MFKMKSDGLLRWCVSFYFLTSVLLQVSGFSFSSYGDEYSTLTRVRRAPKKCNGFRCVTSQKCIKNDKRCDGAVDCQDGSDEFNDCRTAVECPGFLFTCDYGACIEQYRVCDGKKDCRDNSDEAHCVHHTVNKVSSNCKSNQFECHSGQCISLDDKCNGVADCRDKSDEIKDTCLNMNCPGFTFVCDYGACVDGFAKCNGIKDCIDNSDEQNCTTTVTVKPPVVTQSPPVITVPTATKGCVLPNHPTNGKWNILGGANAEPQTKVAVNTLLMFTCDGQYKISSETNLMACLEEGWSITTPTCLKVCPQLFTTEVTKVTCYDANKALIKCDSATQGSSATFDCAPYYEAADRVISTRWCWDGSWNLPPPQCIPVCGEKRVSATALIVNGHAVEKGDYPWVTAIFHKTEGTIKNVCGGSMVSQKVILTAAHCVTNNDGVVLGIDLIKIGVGKYYKNFQDPRDTQAQYSDIAKILVHDRYKGENQRFASDIAFLVTKDQLLLSKVVQPVCFHDLPNIHLTIKTEGVITGWGFTTPNGDPSDTLKETPMPFKDQSTCLTELPSEWADKYYTYDKMCAGFYNQSTAVCKGDSGGGLVFPNKDGRFYIHGIVSIGKGTDDGGCDIQLSALYTKVAAHYDWLEQITSQYR